MYLPTIPIRLKRSIDKANICFLHAPLFHPAMKTVAPIRRELGVKTFFNMLGPMVNPAKAAKPNGGCV
jgi:anthranilate phosphoribosyltransferase